MDWFLYDNDVRHESVKAIIKFKKKMFCHFITTILTIQRRYHEKKD